MSASIITKLIAAYDEYAELLASSEHMLVTLAVSHGFRFPPDKVKRGEELRAEIEKLKSQIPPIFL